MVDKTNSKALPTGLRIRDGSIEINFTHNKQRHYLTLRTPRLRKVLAQPLKLELS